MTKEANFLLISLYHAYQSKRKSGVDRATAKMFAGPEYIQEAYIPDWSVPDTLDAMNELCSLGFLACQHGDNTILCCKLTNEAIAYAENRVLNGFKDAIEALSQLRQALLP